ncbi:MAG: ral nucleoside transport system ATP-binding protein [Thermoleophilaceae bacterium]|nr:ral nucleoside transport system ATP-binding protein [Thermoleophilaceae bacterium]
MTTTTGNGDVALRARGVTKRFPNVLANDGVDFEIRPGEIHALLGENGSGKSTLCKILTGFYWPDEGSVSVGGDETRFRSPADAHAAGVFMVHQHFSLVARMSVAENVVLGWSRERGLRFDRRKVEAEVRAVADDFDMQVDPQLPVWQLSVGEQQRIEILKALYRGARILILDEPTAVLTPQEVERLFHSLRKMAAAGSSIVFISHKLHEVLEVCDRVTVLRQGRNAGEVDLRTEKDVDGRSLARMMVGRDIQLSRRSRERSPGDRVVLRLADVGANNDFDREVVKGVSLEVRSGEIVGVAGVAGNGQQQLAEAIAGLRRPTRGSIELEERALPPGDPRAAIEGGLAYVPEDRTGVGLAAGLRVDENIALKAVRGGDCSVGPFVHRGRVRRRAADLLEAFDVRGRPDSLVRQLSGGNAQKVLLARELSSEPKLLLIASPTRGLDVSAMEAVRKLVVSAADSGVAVLMISEDLDEVLDLSDRVAVMCDGRVTGIVDAEGADPEQIGMLMMGQTAAA